MTDFSEIIARVSDEYDSHQAEWLASLSPEKLAILKSHGDGFYLPPKRKGYSIETLSPRRVWRSMHPYIGASLGSKKRHG